MRKFDPTKHIQFQYLECPTCNTQMTAEENLPADLAEIVRQGVRMRDMVMQRALDRAKLEGLD
jgi:hypothetical protein